MADFRLTEDMYNSNYYRQENTRKGAEERVPIKWMALESIKTHVFDESTDVVSPVCSLVPSYCIQCFPQD